MQWLKITNDTIYRKIKMRSLKVYNLFWSITLNKCKKNATLNTCFCVVASSENANIDDVIMTFLPRE